MARRQGLGGGQRGAEVGAVRPCGGARGGTAHRAVLEGRGQVQWRDQRLDVGLGAPGHQRQGAIKLLAQPLQQVQQLAGDHHRVGAGGQFGECAVEIQKQGRPGGQQHGQSVDHPPTVTDRGGV